MLSVITIYPDMSGGDSRSWTCDFHLSSFPKVANFLYLYKLCGTKSALSYRHISTLYIYYIIFGWVCQAFFNTFLFFLCGFIYEFCRPDSPPQKIQTPWVPNPLTPWDNSVAHHFSLTEAFATASDFLLHPFSFGYLPTTKHYTRPSFSRIEEVDPPFFQRHKSKGYKQLRTTFQVCFRSYFLPSPQSLFTSILYHIFLLLSSVFEKFF